MSPSLQKNKPEIVRRTGVIFCSGLLWSLVLAKSSGAYLSSKRENTLALPNRSRSSVPGSRGLALALNCGIGSSYKPLPMYRYATSGSTVASRSIILCRSDSHSASLS
jgi:hypothetical protein